MKRIQAVSRGPGQKYVLPRPKRASILLTTVVMLVVAGLAILALIQLTTQNVRDVARSEQRLQAFYTAEAGAQRVIDWFNRPEVSPDPEYFSPDEDGNYVDELGRSIITESLEAPPDFLPEVRRGANEAFRGRVTTLIVEPPWSDDPPFTVARLTSIGEADGGVDATVQMRLMDNRVPSITSPGAILSLRAASSGGQFQVNWGEIWTREALHLPQPLWNRFPTSDDDPWFGVRSETHLRDHQGSDYADGRDRHAYTSTPIEPTAPNYYQPFLEETLHQSNNNYRGYENLWQHQQIDWPTYDYETMKHLVQYHGFPIYRTTPEGDLITGHDANGEPIVQTFMEVFDSREFANPNEVDPDNAPPIYFIDTVDGNPPAPDGSNMATIRVQGQGPFFHGSFFIAANVRFGGAGNSPSLDHPRRPDDSIGQRINDTRLYGLFYTYGLAELYGNGDIFGSIIAEGGFEGGGNWEVFYDHRLSDESRTRIGSRLMADLWNSF